MKNRIQFMRIIFLLVFISLITSTFSQTMYPDLILDLDQKIFAPNEYTKQNYYEINSKHKQFKVTEYLYKYSENEAIEYKSKQIYIFDNQKIKYYEFTDTGFPITLNYEYKNGKISKLTKTTITTNFEYLYKYHKSGYVNNVEVNSDNNSETAIINFKDSIVTIDEFDSKKGKILTLKYTFSKNKIKSIERHIYEGYQRYSITKLRYTKNDKLEKLTFEENTTGIFTDNFKHTLSYSFNDKNLLNVLVYESKSIDFMYVIKHIYDEFGNWTAKYTIKYHSDLNNFKIADLSLRQYNYLSKTTGYKNDKEFELVNEVKEKIEKAKNRIEINNYFNNLNEANSVVFSATKKTKESSKLLTIENDLAALLKKITTKKNGKLTLGNNQNGFGEITYADNSNFRGIFKNGKRHGIGIITKKDHSLSVLKFDSANIDKYEYVYISNPIEEFVGNQFTKKGFYHNKISNLFYNVALNDEGNIETKTIVDVHKADENNCIIGDCQNGFSATKVEDNTYFGNFKNYKINGYGMRTPKYGDRRSLGQFKDNELNGFGVEFFSKDIYYAGEFKNGDPNGLGFLYNGEENYFAYAIWKNEKIDKMIQTNIPKDKR